MHSYQSNPNQSPHFMDLLYFIRPHDFKWSEQIAHFYRMIVLDKQQTPCKHTAQHKRKIQKIVWKTSESNMSKYHYEMNFQFSKFVCICMRWICLSRLLKCYCRAFHPNQTLHLQREGENNHNLPYIFAVCWLFVCTNASFSTRAMYLCVCVSCVHVLPPDSIL